jgi:hypothetical protein
MRFDRVAHGLLDTEMGWDPQGGRVHASSLGKALVTYRTSPRIALTHPVVPRFTRRLVPVRAQRNNSPSVHS